MPLWKWQEIQEVLWKVVYENKGATVEKLLLLIYYYKSEKKYLLF